MPHLRDISCHKLVIQWRQDHCALVLLQGKQLREGDSWEAQITEGRTEELMSCILELETVLGLRL